MQPSVYLLQTANYIRDICTGVADISVSRLVDLPLLFSSSAMLFQLKHLIIIHLSGGFLWKLPNHSSTAILSMVPRYTSL